MILVTPLSGIHNAIRGYRPSHMITLLSPEHMIETPDGIVPARHLRIGMNDVADAAASDMPPSVRHVDELLAFGRGWKADAPLLVHCWAGVSRSMAAAYILLCDRLGPWNERDIAQAMRRRAPHAYPNPLMVKLADRALGRDNRMVAAAQSIGRGTIVDEGECVEFPLAPGAL
ncbi:MAG: tyrosine phosphatase family protein [Rhizomicrobium sp.]